MEGEKPNTATTDGVVIVGLRDYFAGIVLRSIYAGDGARMVADRDKRYDETNWAEIVASNAYSMADAMIAQRAKASA